jgi:prepilin-type N-terminal cleavage/methylation domain-containing protein
MKSEEKRYRKKGFTLVEITVSSTIFVVVITLVLGAFLTINRSRLTVSIMKETQQRIRVANEIIARYSKEAEYAVVLKGQNVADSNGGDTLDLFFNLDDENNKLGKRIMIEYDDLNQYECKAGNIGYSKSDTGPIIICSSWESRESLLHVDGSQYNVSIDNKEKSRFVMDNDIPSSLDIKIRLKNEITNFKFDDLMWIENKFILGGLK